MPIDPQMLTTIAMVALMGVAFYFLIIRPQRRRAAEQQAVLRALEPGARVLTSTGIYATLLKMGERQAVLEISPGNELTVVKQAIARVVTADDEDFEAPALSAASELIDDDDIEATDIPTTDIPATDSDDDRRPSGRAEGS